MRLISIVVMLVLPVLTAFADEPDPPIRWGEIPMEDLTMTAFPADSNANAVVLCDYGELTFDSQFQPMFTRHVRIKILKQAGYDIATREIHYYAKDDVQRVRHIDGVTYTLGSDGKIKETEMNSDAVFDEKTSEGGKRVKFTLPALTPGCVIEFRYTIRSTNPEYVPDWEFQTSEPTRWSEFRFKCPGVLGYGMVWQGFEPFFIKDEGQIHQSFGGKYLPVAAFRWVVKDAPAIRDEAYITTTDDYINKLSLQLSEFALPGYYPEQFRRTWDELAVDLMKHERFGKQLGGFSSVRKKSEDLIAGIRDSMERVVKLYDFVRSTIVWDGRERFMVAKDLDDILELKAGSSAEVNLLLVSLLREAGFDADPVLLSTRSNGKIQRLYPIYSQFNYLIARVNVNGKTLFLDATDRLRPYSLLPVRALNHIGWLIKNEKTQEWVDVNPTAKSRSITAVNVSLGADGSLKGQVDRSFSDYRAFDERTAFNAKGRESYIKNLFETETAGIAVDSFVIHDLDSIQAPVRVEALISAPTYGQVLNDFIYFNPVVTARYTDNPLKLAKRTFPVDMARASEGTLTVNIKLPDGYVVKELPRDMGLQLPLNGGSYSRKLQVEGNMLQMRIKYDLNQLLFESRQYPGLKEFFDRRVLAENEQVVLEKKPQAAVVPAVQPVEKAASKKKK